MARAKCIEDYLGETSNDENALEAYLKCPASTFLSQVCHTYDAFRYCELKFTKKQDGTYNKDSQESLNFICCSLLSTIMGHFETYQKSLLAGLIDWSIHIDGFSIDRFTKSLSRSGSSDFIVNFERMLAQRGSPAHVGYVIADSLSGWHNPKKVSTYFQGVGLDQQAFSGEQISDLDTLWQLRHSIVHTGAFLTAADSQKAIRLTRWANQSIVFDNLFYNWFSRRLHKIVKDANDRLRESCIKKMRNPKDQTATKHLNNFLAVSSPKTAWLD